jgi:hypothetical protein
VIIGGGLPMCFVAFTSYIQTSFPPPFPSYLGIPNHAHKIKPPNGSSPFVTYIHLRLPIFARRSTEILRRYSRSLPPNAILDITTMRFSGRPRVTPVKVSELEKAKGRFGVANFRRIETVVPGLPETPWWKPKRVSRFYIAEREGTTRESGIWENVKECIGKYSAKPVLRAPRPQESLNSRPW